MAGTLAGHKKEFTVQFDNWLKFHLEQASKNPDYSRVLLESQSYSILSGGKRFRPFLAYMVYILFSHEIHKIRSFCLALEMIHTYSLIHDDLPIMDNDDLRRGKPTNHKVFSEDISLLAGDGLLTDAFFMIGQDELIRPDIRIDLIKMMSEKAGSSGMVSGQALDMKADSTMSFADLQKIHRLKTGNLIQLCAKGSAIIAGCSQSELHNISEFSVHLGMAFQIKDDLLDHKDKEQDYRSYVHFIGIENTTAKLKSHSERAFYHVQQLNKSGAEALQELVEYNMQREF